MMDNNEPTTKTNECLKAAVLYNDIILCQYSGVNVIFHSDRMVLFFDILPIKELQDLVSACHYIVAVTQNIQCATLLPTKVYAS